MAAKLKLKEREKPRESKIKINWSRARLKFPAIQLLIKAERNAKIRIFESRSKSRKAMLSGIDFSCLLLLVFISYCKKNCKKKPFGYNNGEHCLPPMTRTFKIATVIMLV